MQFRRGKYVVLGVVTVLLARNEIWKRGGTLRLTVSATHVNDPMWYLAYH